MIIPETGDVTKLDRARKADIADLHNFTKLISHGQVPGVDLTSSQTEIQEAWVARTRNLSEQYISTHGGEHATLCTRVCWPIRPQSCCGYAAHDPSQPRAKVDRIPAVWALQDDIGGLHQEHAWMLVSALVDLTKDCSPARSELVLH